jgi:hypothetical protein
LKLIASLLIAFTISGAREVSAQVLVEGGQDRLVVNVVGDVLHIRSRGFQFIQGEAMGRLKNGHQVRFDFELSVLAKLDDSPLTRNRQSFNLSYDLWEERFAVTRIGTPSRGSGVASSISHLTLAAAEVWCLEQLALPLQALRQRLGGRPFWIRLDYRVQTPDDGQDADAALTLRRLIEILGRRKPGEVGQSVTAGPFRLN